MLVYIIKSDEENSYATLDKEIAKQLIKDEILNAETDEEFDEEEVEAFAQDLVDGNTEYRYCDEFDGVSVWCDILELETTYNNNTEF